MMGKEVVKVLDAAVVPGMDGAPGTLRNQDLTVACGKGSLQLKTVQRAGKNPVDGASFLRGVRLSVGDVL
jgi:methionyl-tRNA formyltransferase